MGHHHKNHKPKGKSLQTQSAANTNPNTDIGALLQNMNLNDIDLSKVDMNKVQSIMDKMSTPAKSGKNINDIGNSSNDINNSANDPRIYLLNSLKDMLPGKKAKKIAKITKLLQLTNSMNVKR